MMRLRRRRDQQNEEERLRELGVFSPWSTTYAIPVEPSGFRPTARKPGARVRVVPNETLLPGPLGEQLGDLMQRLVDEGADHGIEIELDTSDRTRPDEMRGGASPVEVLAIVLLYVSLRGADQLTDRLWGAAIDWVLRHRQNDSHEPVIVKLYDANGDVIRKVEVPQDGRDPIDREP